MTVRYECIIVFCICAMSVICEDTKRLLLNDPDVLNDRINRLESTVQQLLTHSEQQAKQILDQAKHIEELGKTQKLGDTYTIWGKRNCPTLNGTTKIYTGYAAGSFYSDIGSGAEYICLPSDPIFGRTDAFTGAHGRVYGSEYWGSNFFAKDGEDVPCAVCHINFISSILMIPGRKKCYPGWNMEYHGYLSSGAYNHAAPSSYACVDIAPDVLNGGEKGENGKLFYPVVTKCDPLQCPPYHNNYLLTCVVCSK